MNNIDDFDIKSFQELIGKNVKRIRVEKGFSQLALSQAIGHKSVSVISYAEVSHKGYHFNVEHLSKIAYILDVNIKDFFEEPNLHS